LDRHSLYLITLALLIVAATSVLAALNESRLDVYLAVFAIIYFALLEIFRPRRRMWDLLAAALIIAFSYIVALKVLQVLFGI
jgi:hypothetical protein